MARRGGFRTALVMTVTVALAACGGASAPPSASSAPASAPAGKPAASPSAVASASSASGSPSAAASAAGKGSVKIGYITDLTGTTAVVGKNGLDGFNLYLDSINNTVAGRKIEVISADDQIKADVGVTKAKQLVESDHVNVIAGILNAAICYALAGYDKQAQVPMVVTAGCNGQSLTTDPKFQNPYLARFTLIPMAVADPMADWAYKKGLRKAILLTPDNAGGIEAGDTFSAAFIERGGTIVQEMHPAFGTADFGPFLAQLDQTADTLYTFLPGADGLRFLQQYSNYGGQRKLQILDFLGVMTEGPNLAQLNQKAQGIVSGSYANEDSKTEMFQKFAKAWEAKYGDRALSSDVIQGYAGAQVIAAALQKINGNAEDKKALMDALSSLEIQTVKGPVKLDKLHDVVQNTYMEQIEKKDNGKFGQKLLQTYPAQSQLGGFTEQQIQNLRSGTRKGKWVGMTKAQLDQMLKGQ